jgi:hypothetical protein
MGWPKGKPRKTKPEAPARSTAADEQTPAQPKPEKAAAPKDNKWSKAETDPKRKSWLARAGNNWGSTDWTDRSEDNALAVPPEIMNWLREAGLDCNWKVESVYGQPQTKLQNQYRANGWVAFDQESASSLCPGFEVEQGGLILMVRPMAISNKARKAEYAKARSPLQEREKMLGSGGAGVPLPSGAGQHHRARDTNFIRRSMEQIEVGPVVED